MLGLLQTNNFISASTITDSGAGTLVLTLSSNHTQTLTGSSAPIVRLPDTTTLSLGHSFAITNLSDVQVRVDHSGSTEVRRLPTLATGIFTCIDTGTNVPASWQCEQNTFTTRGESLPLEPIRLVGPPYIMLKTDMSLLFTASCVLTLYPAAALVGKIVCLKAVLPVTVTSASANVVPVDGSVPGTAILSGVAGEHVKLQSDGTNWVIMGEKAPSGSVSSSGNITAIQLSDGSGGFTNDADLSWGSSTNTLTLGNMGGSAEIIFTGNLIPIGSASTTASGTSAVAIGDSASATGNFATAIGFNASASSQNSVALGNNASANNDADEASIAIGHNADAKGRYGIAIGVDSTAKGVGSMGDSAGNSTVSIGQSALGNVSGVCIGANSILEGFDGVCIGDGAQVTGGYGVGIGSGALCFGPTNADSRNVAIGTGAIAGFGGAQTDAIAVGGGAVAAASGSTAIGGTALCLENNTIALGLDALAQGWSLNFRAPFAINTASNARQVGAPPPGPVARLRVHFGGNGPAVTNGPLTTISAASDMQVLPQATINVVSTATFPVSGTIEVTTSSGAQIVTYTGTTATSFTGCSGGIGTMSTGGAVSLIQTLPQATIYVASTQGFLWGGAMATPATIAVLTTSGFQVVTYTGTTATSFTGCSGGIGTMNTAFNLVSQTRNYTIPLYGDA